MALDTLIRMSMIFHANSGLPRDDAFHDWWFLLNSSDPSGNIGAVAEALRIFYYVPSDESDPTSLINRMAGYLDRGHPTLRMQFWNPATNHAIGPHIEQTLDYSADVTAYSEGEVDLPAEVALCLSYHADFSTAATGLPTTARPAARRRGRIYHGPWNNSAVMGALPHYSRPSGSIAALTHSATTLQLVSNEAGTADTWSWAQYSRSDGVAHPTVGWWVDNEWDTQRRRGQRATTRTGPG